MLVLIDEVGDVAGRQHEPIAAAWVITIALAIAPDVVVAGTTTPLRWATFMVLLSPAIIPFVRQTSRPLRMYAATLFLLQLLAVFFWNGFALWAAKQRWFPQSPSVNAILLQSPKVIAAFIMMAVLALCGYRKREYFLTVGLSLPRWIAPAVGVALLMGLAMFAYLQGHTRNAPAMKHDVLLPLVLASMNAFGEEVLYRGVLLATLLRHFAADQAVMMTAAIFGIAHYYGTPSGLPGIALTLLAGAAFGYSMVRTRGLAVPWFLHLLPDVVIMSMA